MTDAGSQTAGRVIEAEAPAGRLDLAVSGAAGISRAQAQRLIALGQATVEGRAARAGDRLRGGERLLIALPEARPRGLEADDRELSVAYEDASMLIVDKPAGLVIHPAAGHPEGTLLNALVGRARRRGAPLPLPAAGAEWPGLVHRLDRDTSGLLLVAKSADAQAALMRQFAERTVGKEYLALVRGAPPAARGRVEAPLGRHPRDRQRVGVRAGGRDSVTEYELLGSGGGYSLLAVRPLTGRTHQIRAHLAFLGLPVAGDLRYRGGEAPGGLRRQFLHAARLIVRRPDDGRLVRAWSELPADLQASLEAVGDLAATAAERLPSGLGATTEGD